MFLSYHCVHCRTFDERNRWFFFSQGIAVGIFIGTLLAVAIQAGG